MRKKSKEQILRWNKSEKAKIVNKRYRKSVKGRLARKKHVKARREHYNELARKKRLGHIDNGLCGKCNNPALPNRTCCEIHQADAHIKSVLRHRKKADDVKLGICRRCNKPVVPGKKRCANCLAYACESEAKRKNTVKVDPMYPMLGL